MYYILYSTPFFLSLYLTLNFFTTLALHSADGPESDLSDVSNPDKQMNSFLSARPS